MSEAARPDLVDQFETSIRSDLLDRMPPDPSGELAIMPFARLLNVYGNWRSRFPSPRPRLAHVSSVLAAKALPAEHTAVLQAIEDTISAGGDLHPYLSRRVTFAYEPESAAPTRKRQHRSDLDLLLADWKVHHLHLSTALDADGFVQRTDDLLFAMFTPDDAYLIDIQPHGNWTNPSLVETVVRDWPEEGLVMSADIVVGLDNSFTADETAALRNAGVTRFMEIDGRIYLPRSGQTLAGTSLDVALRRMQLISVLDEMRRHGPLTVLNAIRPVSGVDLIPVLHDDDRCGFKGGDYFYELGRLA
jgi:hypothetical protein